MALSRLLRFALGLGLEMPQMAGQIQKAVGVAPQRDLVLWMADQMERVGFEPCQILIASARVDQTLLGPGVLQTADQILLKLPVAVAAAAAAAGSLVQKGKSWMLVQMVGQNRHQTVDSGSISG